MEIEKKKVEEKKIQEKTDYVLRPKRDQNTARMNTIFGALRAIVSII